MKQAVVALLGLVAAAYALAPGPVSNVAVIGAGAAGSSAAYYLRKYAEEDGVGVNITVFEKMDRIGGRTLTVNPYGNSQEHVELGASIFVKLNAILYNATKEFGLDTKPHDEDEGILAIWDGNKFVVDIDESLPMWRVILKILWKYGARDPINTNNLMKATIAKFLNLYRAPYFPFESLTEQATELDLLEATSLTGEQFLLKHNIAGRYAHDIVQASTRVNYASNLAHIHGLDTMVAMAPEGAMAVAGGNWRIFDNMVSSSGAALALNTSVTSIALVQAGEAAAYREGKYILKTRSRESAATEDEVYPALFDRVIVATPYQYSKMNVGDGVLRQSIDEIPYITLHVTLFTSPMSLSPSFFNFSLGSRSPDTVLTTLADDDEPTSGVQGAGKAGFYSISKLKRVVNPKTGKQEYLYKIFSPEEVTPEFLSSLLGAKVPDSFTSDTTATTEGDSRAVEPISWYYPHVFRSYPKAYPRVTFQDPVVGDGVYYTSGMESFISTMETSALMGMNVARLVVNEVAAPHAVAGDSDRGVPAQDEQDAIASPPRERKMASHGENEEL